MPLRKKKPGLVQRAKTYRSARQKWIDAGRPLRTAEEMQAIHDTHCKPCEQFDGKACGKCGCGIKQEGTFLNKLAWATENRPNFRRRTVLVSKLHISVPRSMRHARSFPSGE